MTDRSVTARLERVIFNNRALIVAVFSLVTVVACRTALPGVLLPGQSTPGPECADTPVICATISASRPFSLVSVMMSCARPSLILCARRQAVRTFR